MQALDFVRPPCDRRPAPFGQQRRVMPLFLCKLAYLVRECQRFGKIAEAKLLLQVVLVDDSPIASQFATEADKLLAEVFPDGH